MNRRTRRAVLAGAGLSIATLGAGCLDETGDPGGADDGNGEENDENGDGNGDDEDVVPEAPRVDEPPHEIEVPAHDGEEPDDWNEDYLGEEMATEPAVAFESIDRGGYVLTDPLVSLGAVDGDASAYAVRTIESESTLEDVVDLPETDEESRPTLADVDFDERVVVVVESGFGSSSVHHRFARVEPVDDGLHLHGYYTQPQVQTDDYAPRHSVVVADRPDENGDLDLARVSLTVSAERRVHYNSTEGLVTVEE